MNAFRSRGVMLDPARTMERKSYYTFLLPWLKQWGYNALHMHLTDDQGCALAFPSHPELASPGAWTAGEMRAFVRQARRAGLRVIPEIETLGHTKCITHHPRHRHLGSGNDRGDFTAINPDHPGTRTLLSELLADTAEIFDDELIHVGLDEVNFSGLPKYRNVPKAEHWKAFARHAGWVLERVRRLKRRPAIWGDHLLSEPKLADRIGKDVLIVDWHYDPGYDYASLQFFRTRKFEVWGAPASCCWRTRILGNPDNTANLREFSAAALPFAPKTITGMLNTVWCPSRYLAGAMDWLLALGGHLFSCEEEDPAFSLEFCRSFYGLSCSKARPVADALVALHAVSPWSGFHARVMVGTRGGVAFNREDRRQCREKAAALNVLAGILRRACRAARWNADRLHDVAVSARLLEREMLFGAAGRSLKGLPPARSLIKEVEQCWDRTRDPSVRPALRRPAPLKKSSVSMMSILQGLV